MTATEATAPSRAREFGDRFTVFPDSGDVELHCTRHVPQASVWKVGYHPSLDVLIEQARAHDQAEHGDAPGMVTVSAAELVAAGLVAQRAEEAAAMLGETLLRQEARARQAEAKLAKIRELAEYWAADGGQDNPTLEMAIEAECGRQVLAIIANGEAGQS